MGSAASPAGRAREATSRARENRPWGDIEELLGVGEGGRECDWAEPYREIAVAVKN
jgi:hypothetical protein